MVWVHVNHPLQLWRLRRVLPTPVCMCHRCVARAPSLPFRRSSSLTAATRAATATAAPRRLTTTRQTGTAAAALRPAAKGLRGAAPASGRTARAARPPWTCCKVQVAPVSLLLSLSLHHMQEPAASLACGFAELGSCSRRCHARSRKPGALTSLQQHINSA